MARDSSDDPDTRLICPTGTLTATKLLDTGLRFRFRAAASNGSGHEAEGSAVEVLLRLARERLVAVAEAVAVRGAPEALDVGRW